MSAKCITALSLALSRLVSCSTPDQPNQFMLHQVPAVWTSDTLNSQGQYRNLFASPKQWPHDPY